MVRGEKRKLLAVLIETDAAQEYARIDTSNVKTALLQSGLWTLFTQRPYGVLADPAITPKAIFVSAFHTAPLAADLEFTLGDQVQAIQKGIDALGEIAPLHVSIKDTLIF